MHTLVVKMYRLVASTAPNLRSRPPSSTSVMVMGLLSLVSADCGGRGAPTQESIEGTWEATTGTSTTVCGDVSTTDGLTVGFGLRFQSDGAGGLDLIILDQNDVMVGSCVVVYSVSGNKAILDGAQTCSDGTTTITWTQDVFTLSEGGAALDEVGAFTNPAGCMGSNSVHYLRKAGGTGAGGAKGTGAGTGTGGGTGATGGTGCDLCDKAGACCLAAEGIASACTLYSAAKCNAQPAAEQSGYVRDICQNLLYAESSSGQAACQ